MLRQAMFLAFAFFAMPVRSDVYMGLRQRNTGVLIEALQNVSDPHHPQYGQFWTQSMIDDTILPPQADTDKLMRALDSDGCLCRQISATIHCDRDPSERVDLGLVEMVEKTPTFNASPPVLRHSRSVAEGDGYVGREVMIDLYNITSPTVQLSDTSVCAVEYQDIGGFNQSDLLQQQALNGEVAKKVSHIVGVNQGPMIETQLDLQMMSQVAENADIWFWGGARWLYSFAVNFLNATTVPDILSMSWGWSTRQQCDGLGVCPHNMTSAVYVNRTNLEYVKMGLRGISVLVASGDAGAPGRTNEGCSPTGPAAGVNPAFPGSSPYVTSVGATFLVPDGTPGAWTTPLCKQYGCAHGTSEMGCNFASTGWTAGGGFSIFNETRPAWQKAAVEGYLHSHAVMPPSFPRGARGYPDVSSLGHFCPVVTGGSLMGVDGTSCACPVFASLVALLNDHQAARGKSKLGFANPVLYGMWGDDPSIFNDITKGNNWCTESGCCPGDGNTNMFGYEAAKGWDPVTGLGTPNYGKMEAWLDSNTN